MANAKISKISKKSPKKAKNPAQSAKKLSKSLTNLPRLQALTPNEVLPATPSLDDAERSEDSVSFDELLDDEIESQAKDLTIEEPKQPETLPALKATKGALSVTDPLKQYLSEVAKIPLLSPEEEHRLAVRMREKGDLEAARALVQANLRLVVKIAFEYRSVYANVMDLIQEGNMGLMKAVSKYDLDKGARFGYYSSWWIRSYILKYLLDNFRLVRVGTTQAQKKLFFHLMQEQSKLESQGILPAPKLLASRLNVREKDVVEMQGRLGPQSSDLSLEAEKPSEDGNGISLKSRLVDPAASPEEVAIDHQGVTLLKQKLPAFKKILNGKELSILEERLLAEEPKTLQEVADRYSLTRERARQIEAKVLVKLREFLESGKTKQQETA